MKIDQKGIAPIIILVVIALSFLVIVNIYNSQKNDSDTAQSPKPLQEASPSASITPTSSPTASPSASPKPTVKPTPKPTVEGTPKPTEAPVAANNTPPSSGYSKQTVQTDSGSFSVSIGSADLGSTRVIVDTASSDNCSNDCPVLSLADYIGRNGAYAGVNGSYFCPASYPSCEGKTNSFDSLLMNKDKKYFNSDNNVYSTLPAAIFQSGSVRYVGQSQEWGRDTGVDGVIANYPMLVQGGNIAYAGSGDSKLTSRGNRSFVGSTGSTVYIGVVFNATVEQTAQVLHAMGIQDALNLDDGGSTALWWGGYKAGPGRQIPNAILFVNR